MKGKKHGIRNGMERKGIDRKETNEEIK